MRKRTQPEVVVYASFDCPTCDSVREFLADKGIPFLVRDIDEDESARKEMEEFGLQAVPVVVIDGRPISGFERARLEQALKKESHPAAK